jgi:omega-6 fatty acid desaturase (delta-12 desaturase)
MRAEAGSDKLKMPKPAWYQALGKYAYANLNKSLWQVIDTFVPYCVLWALMLYTVRQGYPYWVTLALAVVAGGILVRVFILFHDCCHGSFFASRRANTILGYVAGILTFTPYEDWRYAHNIHHATQGDVDRQGVGDIWTMRKKEYLKAPRRKRLAYRIYRNPFVLFGPGPALLFLFFQRFATKGAGKKERHSVLFTNLALLTIIGVASSTIGFQTYLLIQLPIILIASTFGLWLFMFSINLKVCIGPAMNSGTPREWHWRVVLISSCRKSSNGSQATLVCITFITRDPRFPIIICNSATMTSRRSRQSYR